MTFSLVVLGPPRTKKTHNRLVPVKGRLVVLPSLNWERWVKSATIVVLEEGRQFEYSYMQTRYSKPRIGERIRREVSFDRVTFPGYAFFGLRPLTTEQVRCAAVFYRDRNHGDAVGYYQGLADLLEKRGVLKNDRQIVDWRGSQLLKDSRRPRVELTLEVLA